jgi:tetratricopeptide (TPR) repeat protein
VRETEQAQSSRRQGDHARAAEHYERAAQLADKPRDAEEARYRAADSYARAGDTRRAEAIYSALASQAPDAERRTRADYALAELWRRAGREAEAEARIAAAIRRDPNSGLARQALQQHVSYLRQQGGSEQALAYLVAEERALGTTELGETLVYLRARELDQAGRDAEARDAYLECARRFPYPRGAYWDDALFRAGEKELVLGAPRRAIAHLERMVAEQESAVMTGSYERGRYAEAQKRIGEIYRDALGDDVSARRALRLVWQKHPKSRLADDALFEEALLAKKANDDAGTCEPLAILLRELPDSRYAGCAHLLCGSLAAKGDCHDYIKRAAGLP